MYNAYVEYEKVQNNTKYSNIYDKLEKSYKKYKDAIQSGKKSDIEKQKEEYAKLFEESTRNINDKGVINYFKNLYPDLKNEVNSWEFELNFKSKKNKDMKDDIQKIYIKEKSFMKKEVQKIKEEKGMTHLIHLTILL